MNAIR